MAKPTDQQITEAVAKWEKDLDAHKINSIHWIGYYGSPNPKEEPRLHEPSAYSKLMIVVNLTFNGEAKAQERVVFVAKP